MIGTVSSIEDHGTVVLLLCKGERFFMVPFDHQPFQNMFESEGGDVIGREVEYDEETRTMEFTDEEGAIS